MKTPTPVPFSFQGREYQIFVWPPTTQNPHTSAVVQYQGTSKALLRWEEGEGLESLREQGADLLGNWHVIFGGPQIARQAVRALA